MRPKVLTAVVTKVTIFPPAMCSQQMGMTFWRNLWPPSSGQQGKPSPHPNLLLPTSIPILAILGLQFYPEDDGRKFPQHYIILNCSILLHCVDLTLRPAFLLSMFNVS
jgi:hypothetical protein